MSFGCMKQFCLLQLPIPYWESLEYGYHKTRHIFFYMFENGKFFSCEICHGSREKYELSCDTKISLGLEKKRWKNQTRLLEVNTWCASLLSQEYLSHLISWYRETLKCMQTSHCHWRALVSNKLNVPIFSRLFQWDKKCNSFQLYFSRNCHSCQ